MLVIYLVQLYTWKQSQIQGNTRISTVLFVLHKYLDRFFFWFYCKSTSTWAELLIIVFIVITLLLAGAEKKMPQLNFSPRSFSFHFLVYLPNHFITSKFSVTLRGAQCPKIMKSMCKEQYTCYKLINNIYFLKIRNFSPVFKSFLLWKTT